MPGPVAPVNCPKCDGPMWDNSRDPKKSKNASDYRCKDRQNCNGGVWLTDAQRDAASPTQAVPSAQAPAGSKRPPLVIDNVVKAAIKASQAMIDELYGPGADDVPITEVIRIALSISIARLDNKGILEIEKAALVERGLKEAALKAEADRLAAEKRKADMAAQAEKDRLAAEKPPINFDDFPAALMDQDDDLPF